MSEATVVAPEVPAAVPAPAPAAVPAAAEPIKTAEAPPGDPAKAAEIPKGAPETYAEFKIPEGLKADADAVKTFTEQAKAANLTQEQAQAFVDLQSKLSQKAADAWKAEQTSWKERVAKDPVLGGADSPAKIAVAQAAFTKFGDPGFKALVEMLGIGDHPDLLRFAFKVGSAIKEDTVAGTHGSTGEKPSGQWTADDFYAKAQKPNATKTA